MSLARSVLMKGGSVSTGLGTVGAGLGAAGAAAAASFGREGGGQWMIPEGYVAVRTRFKRVQKDMHGNPMPRIKGPGLRMKMPFADNHRLISTQERASDLGKIPIDRDRQLSVEATALWKVSDKGNNPYRALFNPQDGELGQIVTALCANGLRKVMTEVDESQLQNEKYIYSQVNYLCHEKLLHYGSILLGISLQSVAPRGEELIRTGIREGLSGLGSLATHETTIPELTVVKEAYADAVGDI